MTAPKKVDKELYKIMHERMIEQGWENIRRFTEGSKVPYSIETTRRLFSECEYKSVAPITIAIVAKYLGFDNDEIKEILQTYTTDRDVWPLIGDSKSVNTKDEEAWLAIFHAFKGKSVALEKLLSQVELIAELTETSVEKNIKLLRREI